MPGRRRRGGPAPRGTVVLPPRETSVAPRSVAVVGGGILGLTLALRLARAGHRVAVVEGTAQPGGLVTGHDLAGVTWDRFYHVTLYSDLATRALLDEIGMGDALRWSTTGTRFYVDGRHHPFSNALDFLRFPPLSLIDKARLGLTILRASRTEDWPALEQVTAADWLRAQSGDRATDRIWIPLLRAKLGTNWDRVSAAFIVAIIKRMYAARRAGLEQEKFGWIDGGYEAVLRALRDTLTDAGVTFVTGRPAERVLDAGGHAELELAGGARLEADAVALTVPCATVARLCPQLSATEQARLRNVTYQGVICASVLLRQPLSGCYVTNICDERIPFTGLIEMTALVDPAVFGGRTLVYLPRYIAQDDPLWQESDEAFLARCIGGLRRMYPRLTEQDIVTARVARARDVQALATLNFTRRLLPPLATSLPRVFVANSAQIVNGTLNVNETVALAATQAEGIGRALATLPIAAAAARVE